jgi:hypothetical protein
MTSPDETAAAAARDFAGAVSARWTTDYGDALIGVYLLGSLAHGGFSRRYSDIDVGVIAERALDAAMLDAMRRTAGELDGEQAKKLSIFWADQAFSAGRFPPLDRLDYLDRPVVLIERRRIALPRPTLREIRAYLCDAPMTNWHNAADTFAAAEALAPKDRKSYLRAHLYPARFTYSFMTGKMASNDDAVAFLDRFAPAGLDVALVRRALDIRRAADDPDVLFPERTALPRQFAACAALVAESEAERP